nr:DUF4352 domain-containing protein [Listeria grayi]
MSVTKTVNNMDMKIADIQTTENGKGSKNIVNIEMKFVNNDSTETGVGAYDFKLKAADKTYEVSDSGNNFGDTFKPGKTLTGHMYFELPKDVKTAQLIYTPQKKRIGKLEYSYSRS